MTDKSAAAIREFAEKQFPLSKELKKEVLYNQIQQAKQNECLSDLTALIEEHYVSKEEHNKVVQQRDELREALVDMVNQFAYRGTYEGRENLHTGGLSALESAFDALDISDPITILDFEAAIKNTDG